jgi:hypothetical protein
LYEKVLTLKLFQRSVRLMLTTGYSSWLWLVFYFLSLPLCFAQSDATISAGQVTLPQPQLQTAAPSQTSPSTLLTFQQNQQALSQSFNALLSLNPTPQQIQAWRQQNATALANQQQFALNMAAESAVQPMAATVRFNIPANASQTMKDFLTTQASMANTRAQIHNQLLNALPAEVSEAQISQTQLSEVQTFHQQQGANLQLQAQRAQTLASESARRPKRLPPPLMIPAGATPQLRALLTARDQLMRDQINFSNQYVNATPAARQAALAQWMQQNAGRIQQMQQSARNLSAATTTTQN